MLVFLAYLAHCIQYWHLTLIHRGFSCAEVMGKIYSNDSFWRIEWVVYDSAQLITTFKKDDSTFCLLTTYIFGAILQYISKVFVPGNQHSAQRK